MHCRRHGRKPTLALWMLVAIAILTTTAGAEIILATLVVLAGGVAMARVVTRRTTRTSRRA